MSIESAASISTWIRELKDGEQEAASQLWARFFEKLRSQVELRIRNNNFPHGMVESEDVVASVFESLWNGAQAGRFATVANRHELWWLLLSMTHRKLVSHWRHVSAQKRFPGKVPASLSALDGAEANFKELVSIEPGPEYVAMLADECSRLLNLLRDDKLKQIAVLLLEGLGNQEIADRLGISVPTVVRKVRLIRETWSQDDNSHDQTE